MRVISRKILRDYCLSHADACDALYDWYRVAKLAKWQNLTEVQATYKTAEAVGNFTVFNIKGNRYRLIVDIIYPSQRIYIKYVLTADAFASRHLQSRCAGTYVPPEYDKNKWKNDPYY